MLNHTIGKFYADTATLFRANLPSRFFAMSATLIWLAVHAIYAHLQFRAFEGNEDALGWLVGWYELSPWFIAYIFHTITLYTLTKIIESKQRPIKQRIILHTISMGLLLVANWLSSTALYFVITQADFATFIPFLLQMLSTTMQLDLLICFGLLSMILGLCFHDKRIQEKLDFKNLQTALIDEQLKTLRTQLNPHFLFNALNTAVSLIRLKRDEEAVQALAELSSMLRKILEHKHNTNSKVKEEIAFIKNYLCIQQMRFSDKLDVKISVEDCCLEVEIPNMLLHPLVENAVQHGSQLESNQNLVDLKVSRNGDQLLVKLTNRVAENDQHKGFGIGVSNTKDRLKKLYKDYRLDLCSDREGFFETTLVIPICVANV
ncbi:sensor histidine kinase [Paraglaciecola arctica]|uniref:sensor histidine kinase n=1 Tax=Paraglaciecola arctica TaxID=1128911 RepID=UPI001C07A4AF|nr:histidine kinase [Paraglaciecola arctica]MBU3004897.1 histidine kinase [Paraglaciecola arctica]